MKLRALCKDIVAASLVFLITCTSARLTAADSAPGTDLDARLQAALAKPPPADRQAALVMEVRQAMIRQAIITPWQQRGQHGKWDKDVELLLPALLTLAPRTADGQETSQVADRVAKSGCQDLGVIAACAPLINYGSLSTLAERLTAGGDPPGVEDRYLRFRMGCLLLAADMRNPGAEKEITRRFPKLVRAYLEKAETATATGWFMGSQAVYHLAQMGLPSGIIAAYRAEVEAVKGQCPESLLLAFLAKASFSEAWMAIQTKGYLDFKQGPKVIGPSLELIEASWKQQPLWGTPCLGVAVASLRVPAEDDTKTWMTRSEQVYPGNHLFYLRWHIAGFNSGRMRIEDVFEVATTLLKAPYGSTAADTLLGEVASQWKPAVWTIPAARTALTAYAARKDIAESPILRLALAVRGGDTGAVAALCKDRSPADPKAWGPSIECRILGISGQQALVHAVMFKATGRLLAVDYPYPMAPAVRAVQQLAKPDLIAALLASDKASTDAKRQGDEDVRRILAGDGAEAVLMPGHPTLNAQLEAVRKGGCDDPVVPLLITLNSRHHLSAAERLAVFTACLEALPSWRAEPLRVAHRALIAYTFATTAACEMVNDAKKSKGKGTSVAQIMEQYTRLSAQAIPLLAPLIQRAATGKDLATLRLLEQEMLFEIPAPIGTVRNAALTNATTGLPVDAWLRQRIAADLALVRADEARAGKRDVEGRNQQGWLLSFYTTAIPCYATYPEWSSLIFPLIRQSEALGCGIDNESRALVAYALEHRFRDAEVVRTYLSTFMIEQDKVRAMNTLANAKAEGNPILLVVPAYWLDVQSIPPMWQNEAWKIKTSWWPDMLEARAILAKEKVPPEVALDTRARVLAAALYFNEMDVARAVRDEMGWRCVPERITWAKGWDAAKAAQVLGLKAAGVVPSPTTPGPEKPGKDF